MGYDWVEDDCFVQLNPLGSRDVVRWEVAGPIAIAVTSELGCAGWIDIKALERRTCPHGALGVKQCAACQSRERYLACVRCDGFNCPRLSPIEEQFCQASRYLYLANFGNEEVKVGTAVEKRKQARLAEQGPLAAVLVAHGPGPSIRRLETTLTRHGLRSSMSKRRKAELFSSAMTRHEAIQILEATRDRIEPLVSDSYGGLLVPSQLMELPPQQGRVWGNRRELAFLEPGVGVVGEVVAAAGSCVVINDGTAEILVEQSSAVGRVIDGDPERAAASVPSRQLTLLL